MASNVGAPQAPLKIPTEAQWDAAERVSITRPGAKGHTWTNHKMGYSLTFVDDSANCPVIVTDESGTYTQLRAGMLADQFDTAIGDELAAVMGWTVERTAAPTPDWGTYTVAELRALLANRGLPTTGKKTDLVARLEKHDDEAE